MIDKQAASDLAALRSKLIAEYGFTSKELSDLSVDDLMAIDLAARESDQLEDEFAQGEELVDGGAAVTGGRGSASHPFAAIESHADPVVVTAAVHRVVNVEGLDVLADPGRLRALLMDELGSEGRRHRSAVDAMSGLSGDVGGRLLHAPADQVGSLLEDWVRTQQHSEQALARWAAAATSAALGISTTPTAPDSTLPSLDPRPTPLLGLGRADPGTEASDGVQFEALWRRQDSGDRAPLPASSKSSRTRALIAAAVVFALTIGVAVAVALVNRPTPLDTTSTDPGQVTCNDGSLADSYTNCPPTSQPSAGDQLSTGEQELLDQLPAGFVDTDSCESRTTNEPAYYGVSVSAAVSCNPIDTEGASRVIVTRYGSAADLEEDLLNDRVSTLPSGDCSAIQGQTTFGVGVQQRWDDQTGQGGRLFCHFASGTPLIDWTYDAQPELLLTATVPQNYSGQYGLFDELEGLYKWWTNQQA